MRKSFILLLIAILIKLEMAQAQTSNEDVTNTRTTFLSSFFETIPGYERKQFVMPDNGEELTYHGITSFTRTQELVPYALEIKATLVYTDMSRTNILAEGLPITFTYLDFAAPEGNATVSKGKSVGITIPSSVNKVDGYFMTKYQVKLLPNSAWSNFMYSTEEQSVPVFATSRITGPNAMCGDGVFSITNPRTITLENANGIATLTALGNNQWKISRVGSANGIVTLKSTIQQNIIASKPIEIGILAPTTIFGPSSVAYNSTYTFSSGDLDPNITYNWTVTNAPTGTNIIGGSSNKSFTISLPPKTSSLPDNGTLLISIRRSGACSGSSDWFVKQIPYTSSSGGVKPPIQLP